MGTNSCWKWFHHTHINCNSSPHPGNIVLFHYTDLGNKSQDSHPQDRKWPFYIYTAVLIYNNVMLPEDITSLIQLNVLNHFLASESSALLIDCPENVPDTNKKISLQDRVPPKKYNSILISFY